ncbi:uracil-DNA glycosylase [Neomoorella humiferrea]|uniref:Type-4 uracil-DNA glycosylase n=1 Tax=Neomoorella humiferrea TaxID=676965 RepID=A0A2T0AK11_9FIRM|nr:uracil-DNA glycosylase [Moorella humiferrea]PRR68723.1 Uracil DNA glycosylase superfamily protein [Moorella humiferrea]
MDLDTLCRRTLACRGCALRQGARRVVFGEGNPRAAIMLVGEGPGAREDELGRPFVGAAGELLDRILVAAGFKREELYITNVVKCRPPGNRQPLPGEVQTCLPILKAQIKLIKPQIIVCLGAVATRALIAPGASITRLRGRWIMREGIRYLPTFHPAALLRDAAKKRPVWEDFKKLRAVYCALQREQLSLEFEV